MRWFKPKVAICSECGVHYKPVTGREVRWGHLCPTHRKPVMERDIRKDAVVFWASCVWEKLEPMYLKKMNKKNLYKGDTLRKAMRAAEMQQPAMPADYWFSNIHYKGGCK